MPLGGNVCKLLFRILIICAFFSLVYTIVTGTPGVPERIQITTTFLVAVSPMIVEIVVLKKSVKMEELKQEEIDEKIQIKVNEYIEAIHEREVGRLETPTTALPSDYVSGNAQGIQYVSSV